MRGPKKLLTGVLIVVLILAGLNVAYNRGLIQNLPVFATALSNPQLVGAIDSANIQFNLLTERGRTLGSHVGEVIGVYVEPNEEAPPPVHQRAFEYARFQYCQQVIRDYEAAGNQPAEHQPNMSVAPEDSPDATN